MKTRMIKVGLLALLFSGAVYAATTTTLNIIKTTTLTDDDAAKFVETFGTQFEGDKRFTFNCHDDECVVQTSVTGFSGDMAEKLLNGRADVSFQDEDKKFKMHCGIYKETTYFCNVIQHGAVLN